MISIYYARARPLQAHTLDNRAQATLYIAVTFVLDAVSCPRVKKIPSRFQVDSEKDPIKIHIGNC